MVKTRSDKVLESLESPEFPKESEMVIYIHKLLRVTIKYKKFNFYQSCNYTPLCLAFEQRT